jgi:tRNA nucleotidyltransferase/poly(A) polymerase
MNDEKQKIHELSEVLKGKDLPALLKWVYDHGQLKAEFPEQSISKAFVLKAAEKAATSRDQQIDLAARIDELEPYSVHVVECKSVGAFQAQKEWFEDDMGKRTFIGKDPLDCFDYLCDCGALKIIDRLATLKENKQ